jgi:hypothetical protein
VDAPEPNTRPLHKPLVDGISNYSVHILLGTYVSMALGAVFQLVAWILFSAFTSFDVKALHAMNSSPLYPFSLIGGLILATLVKSGNREPKSVWVWVPVLAGFIVEFVLWTRNARSVFASPWRHFFAPCSVPQCTDQWLFTVPLYTSISFSLGTLISKATTRRFLSNKTTT